MKSAIFPDRPGPSRHGGRRRGRHAEGGTYLLAGLVTLAFCAAAVLSSASADKESSDIVSGVVRDESGAVPNAVVRLQATKFRAVSGPDGRFELAFDQTPGEPVKLTAWAKGYYIGGPVEAVPGQKDLVIDISRHSMEDETGYEWLLSSGPVGAGGPGENQGCSECHFRGPGVPGKALPVDEWLEDAHSQSARNPRFLSLYSGTDVSGRRSPPTRYLHVKDYGTFPVAPDPDAPYYGPGYKLDYPGHAGNCAACHLAAAAVNAPYDTEADKAAGVGAEGVACDFCHKIWDVRLDPVKGLPFENQPGVLSFEFRRPAEGHQFFAGPLDDVAPGEDTYSELQTKSQLCAPCHFAVFWDTTVYNSFGEWLASSYSDAEQGKTCQDCHMPHSGATRFAREEKGGLARDPATIFAHRMPGAADRELLSNAVTLSLEARQSKDAVRVKVTVTNDLTGHHVPTDSPLRHMILVVTGEDGNGRGLDFVSGPTLPDWCGVGEPAEGNYAGLPGKAFAKILEESWTKISPTAAYWNPTRVVSDTRLGAFETDLSEYAFSVPGPEPVRVEARLLYRRAYKDLMALKGWTAPDILMEKETVVLDPPPDGRRSASISASRPPKCP